MNAAQSRFLLVAMSVLALLFLYAPIVSIVIYSFNESQLVTVWSRFSTKWYAALLHDDQILRAARISIEVALLSATGATVLGTFAGYILSRFGRFPGRTLFSGLVMAPLVMPEIIMGISTLLLFVALEATIGWPHRDIQTIVMAHITFATAFVAVVVQSRLSEIDVSIEEAAADLGARPLQVFFLVTLPLIAPALMSGFLLAFSLSLDDLVITSFVSGPSSTTLPMVIFSKVRLGLNPEINALGALIILFVGVIATIATFRTIFADWRGKRKVETATA
ncbi:putrescine transport system permease protein [Rhodoblastus acidophilus]|uniref:ABC transporter permease subunit n=1 Tax=Rhodoblastus acidophilus TaxID=1074 RepID=UPI002224EB5A|nr:ABC transporter permease subunit [Rhodoblastus acidophilus]MCW2316693.1 putrescine transport system permease protein [Rhodoblastus acidophilus]